MLEKRVSMMIEIFLNCWWFLLISLINGFKSNFVKIYEINFLSGFFNYFLFWRGNLVLFEDYECI